MREDQVILGNWVRFTTIGEEKKVLTGFVVDKKGDAADVAVPSLRATFFSVPFHLLHDHEKTQFTVQQINDMIDIALSIRDFDWVKNLSEMKEVLNKWK